jgi:hypothetical protein
MKWKKETGLSLPRGKSRFEESLAKRLLTNECSMRLRHWKFHERAMAPLHWG